MTSTSFFVPGTPAPQGSKKHVGNGVMIESSKHLKPWRARVAWLARQHIRRSHTGPVKLEMQFYFRRPKRHYGTGRNSDNLKLSAPAMHTQKPDIDKLERAILDALTGIAYIDDSQVVKVVKSKQWRLSQSIDPGVQITVTPVKEAAE